LGSIGSNPPPLATKKKEDIARGNKSARGIEGRISGQIIKLIDSRLISDFMRYM